MTAPHALQSYRRSQGFSELTRLAHWIPGTLKGLGIWEEESPKCVSTGLKGVESGKDSPGKMLL